MRRRANSKGYTIVEVMLFLAISGFTFVLAAVFVNGKQAATEFRQGMNDINTQVQQVINDVGNGFYPGGNNFTCTDSGGVLTINSGTAIQGTNIGCTFLGKVITFGRNSSDSADDTAYGIYSVAGRQYKAGTTQAPANFTDAQPKAIDIDAVTQFKTLQWGLRMTGMYDGSSANPIGGVGFFGSFGNYATGNSSLASGAQTTLAIKLPNSQFKQSKTATTALIAAGADWDTTYRSQPNPNIILCFQNRAKQYGRITIGGSNGQRLTTDMQLSSAPTGACPA